MQKRVAAFKLIEYLKYMIYINVGERLCLGLLRKSSVRHAHCW
jgi:hypothetical protein